MEGKYYNPDYLLEVLVSIESIARDTLFGEKNPPDPQAMLGALIEIHNKSSSVSVMAEHDRDGVHGIFKPTKWVRA
jgi:hypothetical protein